MALKGWKGEHKTIKFTYDYSVHGGAVGTIALGDLPDGFVVEKCSAVIETALVGGGTFVVGEDGGGDDDGYWTDLDAATVGSVVAGTGALVWTAPNTANEIGNEKTHIVAAAKDGVQVKISTTAYTTGKITFYFSGIQS
jgi:hypothetical protein